MRKTGSGRTMKVIAIPSPWNTYPKAQIANALEFAGSIISSTLKAMVPTSIWNGVNSVVDVVLLESCVPKGKPGTLPSWRRNGVETIFPSRTRQTSSDRKR